MTEKCMALPRATGEGMRLQSSRLSAASGDHRGLEAR